MSYINKPKVAHPSLPTNTLGMTRRQYEGSMSTLCAGCGHDSVTAAIIEACWGLSLRPEQLVKLSGIGCSSKTTAYFVSGSHGFNSVHGRMPSIASGANAANRQLTYVGVSGDGDSLSIGIGQLVHAIRRNVNMLYLIENNGVYGLTKGQFSASADIGTKAKRGDVNSSPPIDPVLLALTLGATFVARSFSGDKAQLVPLIQAGHAPQRLRPDRRALALRDLQRSRRLDQELHLHPRALPRRGRGRFRAAGAGDRGRLCAGRVDPRELHDGSRVVLRKLDPTYDPTDRTAAYNYIGTKLKHERIRDRAHPHRRVGFHRVPQFEPSSTASR
jgi:2-oxoglutarate ferredoxin oxidoreductase subunit beta